MRSKPLIVHVPRRLSAKSWGGTERVLEQTVELLDAAGFDQRIFTSRIWQDSDETRLGSVRVRHFRYLYPEWPLPAERREAYDAKAGPLVSFPLAAALRREPNLALVHCHTGGRLGAQCLSVARKRRARCVLTLHGGNFDVPAAEVDSQASEQGRQSSFRVPYGKVLSWWYGTRRLLENVDAVICVGVDEFEKAKLALPRQRVSFLPGGVNLDEFSRADPATGRRLLGVTSQDRVISCIARVDHQKDQATLVRAWARTTPKAKLAIVGPETSSGYAEQLRRLAGAAADRLVLTGGIAPASIPDVVAASEFCVLPSRHEPFGLSCLEAWAAKRCIVAADVGGPGWLLRGEREGRLFPVGDDDALRAVLEDLLANPSSAQRMGEAGHRRATAEFTWAHRTRKLIELYAELGVRALEANE